MLNYAEIGQRIRSARKDKGISQEELAERVGISVTHMSHIETGNTKLSLLVLVCISKALEVSTDALLFGLTTAEKDTVCSELSVILSSSSPGQASIYLEMIRNLKSSMEKYLG